MDPRGDFVLVREDLQTIACIGQWTSQHVNGAEVTLLEIAIVLITKSFPLLDHIVGNGA